MKKLTTVKAEAFLKKAVSTKSEDKRNRKYLLAPHACAGGAAACDGFRVHFAPGALAEADAEFPTGAVEAFLTAPVTPVALVDGQELKNAALAAGTPRRGVYEGGSEQIKLLAIPGHGLVLMGREPEVGSVRAFIPCEVQRRLDILVDARYIDRAIAGKTVRIGIGYKDTLTIESGEFRAVIQPMTQPEKR